MEQQRRNIVIRGTVEALERDGESRIGRVVIVTESGAEYLVANNSKAKELCELVDEEVAVRGQAWEDDDGDLHIRPLAFRLVEWDDQAVSKWVRTWKLRTGEEWS